jgi:hypothetical protein
VAWQVASAQVTQVKEALRAEVAAADAELARMEAAQRQQEVELCQLSERERRARARLAGVVASAATLTSAAVECTEVEEGVPPVGGPGSAATLQLPGGRRDELEPEPEPEPEPQPQPEPEPEPEPQPQPEPEPEPTTYTNVRGTTRLEPAQRRAYVELQLLLASDAALSKLSGHILLRWLAASGWMASAALERLRANAAWRAATLPVPGALLAREQAVRPGRD